MTGYRKRLFVVKYGLNAEYYFMAENAEMASIHLRYFIAQNKLKGCFTLLEIDTQNLLKSNSKKLKYIETQYRENEEKLIEFKKKVEKAAIERERKKQLEILFDGKEISYEK